MESLPLIVLILSIIAGTATLSMNLPQMFKTIKTKDASGLHTMTLVIGFINGMLWTVVGIINLIFLLHEENPGASTIDQIYPYAVGIPVAFANFVLGAASMVMLVIKKQQEKKNKTPSTPTPLSSATPVQTV